MTTAWDLVVVGGGPAGLAAAATAAELGLRTCLVDDNPSPGGQIWRGKPQQVASPALEWVRRMAQSGVTVCAGTRVIDAPQPGELRLADDSRSYDIRYTQLMLATGARELFLPFPGWTLPGVYGAGGLQAFVKSGLSVAGKRVAVAGSGPLLLAVAAGLRSAGAQVLAIIEQAPVSALARFAFTLARHPGKIAEGLGYRWQTARVPFETGSWVVAAQGQEKLESIVVRAGSRELHLPADMLAIGYHLIANTELPQLLGCRVDSGFVSVDSLQRTSVAGIYCGGEATGIGGVDKALVEGRIAALAAADRLPDAQNLFAARDRHLRFARDLATAFSLRSELRTLPQDDTVLCRCEDSEYQAVAACRSWREAKLHTRCGMGPCQGRICGAATRFLFGWELPTPRPPLFPVDMASLAETDTAAAGAPGLLSREG